MRTPLIPAIAVAALTLGLAGCTGADTTEPDTDSTAAGGGELELTELTVGLIPVADYGAVFLAGELGYFEEEGLTVETQVQPNAASIVPGVLNGQLSVGTAAMPPLISAVAEGVPIKAIANAAVVPDSADLDSSAILAKADSGIADAADLAGKTIAVNALNAIADLTTRQAIANAGADPASATFVAMPFPDMAAAVERGDVDAAFVVEPFRTSGVNTGLVIVNTPFYDALGGGTSFSGYFASDQLIAEAPNTIAAFVRAIDKATEAAAADPDLIRGVLVSTGGVDQAVADVVNLPGYSPGFNDADVETLVSVMVEQGYLTDVQPATADIVAQ